MGDGKNRRVRDCFINMRAQRYWELSQACYNTYRAIIKGQYIDPDAMVSFSSEIKCIPRLRSELCRIPRVRRGDGVFQVMSKKDMLAKKIPSPNMADSVMMCMYKPKQSVELELNFQTYY
jgi:phage terminase large subunit